MKEKAHFMEPWPLTSRRLERNSRLLHALLGVPPADIRTLEEGLRSMCSKLIELSTMIYMSFVFPNEKRFIQCRLLAEEIHNEEKTLTAHLVHLSSASPTGLKALVLFPGRLERVGDMLESILRVSMIRTRDGIPLSRKVMSELQELFTVFSEMLRTLRDLLRTCDNPLLGRLTGLHEDLARMTRDFAFAHEDRLIEGSLSPKASSLYIDILDSMRNANRHIHNMTEALTKICSSPEMVIELKEAG